MGSSGALTVKALKSKLDGNELDLSMNDLTAVPVKELVAIPRATRLDLSVNRLTWLSDDFCTLTHLVQLDLSQNQLQQLPDNFGNLVSLEKLDVYKNRLTTLPLSFCRLRKLKWLDLKDNPLTDDLRAVTGDCLDDKQCQLASQKVVEFMQKLQSSQDRERQKRLQKEREEESIRKAAEEVAKREQQTAKKKEKERKRHEKHKQIQNGGQKEQRYAERTGEKTKAVVPSVDKRQKQSIFKSIFRGLWSAFSVLLIVLVVMGCMTLAAALILYSNCSSRPEWIPNSKPLCHDLYQWSTTGAPPSVHNLKLATTSLSQSIVGGSKALFDSIVAVDYGVWGAEVSKTFRRGADVLTRTDYGKLLQDSTEWVSNTTADIVTWCQEEAGPLARQTAEQMRVVLLWMWEEGKVGLRWLLDRTLEAVQWLTEGVRMVIDSMPEYWERAKYYWNNMK